MTFKRCRKLIFTILITSFALSLTQLAHADGDIAFLSPTHTTITAGQAFSWMERSRDWDQVATQTISGTTYAVPNIVPAVDIQVETWREISGNNTNLKMHFSIPDVTRNQPAGAPSSTLNKGDRLIIELDPNNSGRGSGDTDLDVGSAGSNTSDYRFEIVIKDNLIDASLTGCKRPISAAPNNWDTVFDSSPLAPTAIQLVTLNSVSGGRYDLTVTIPGSYVGLNNSATGPVGMSYVYLNDIGHSHPAPMGGTVWEMIGTQFPSSMGLSLITDNPGVSDLGLVTSSLPASGSWLNPSQWASGYFDSAAASVGNNINFSASPDWVFSEDLRIRVCTTTDFGLASEGVAGWSTDQVTLPKWYQYFPGSTAADKPCKARVWFRPRRTNPSAVAVRKRFLIVWGRPFIGGTQDWFVASLTPTIAITAAVDTFNFEWNVPKNNFTNHPCLRIYALPETLNGAAGDGTPVNEAFIMAISTAAHLDKLHEAYGVNPGTPLTAQMNFTALRTGNCPAGTCFVAALPGRDRKVIDDSGVRIVTAGFQPSSDADNSLASTSVQDRPGEEPRDNIRVFVEGFGIESPPSTANYAFLKTLGGVGTMVSNKDLAEMKDGMTIQLDVGNPRFERVDIRPQASVGILSPQRTIFLNVIVRTPAGVERPTFTVNIDKTSLGPGETTKGTVVVVPPTDVNTSPNFKRWGLSLHGGVSIPHGNLNSVFNPGPNVGVDLEYRFNSMFSLEGIYTFHRFNGETFGAFTIPDLNVHQVSVNGKVYGSSAPWRPFFNFGGGVYNFNTATTRGGVNVGGGLQFDVTPNVAVDAMYNFHNVFTSGANTRFSTVQGGVRFRF